MNVRNALNTPHFNNNKNPIHHLKNFYVCKTQRGAHFPCEGKAREGPKWGIASVILIPNWEHETQPAVALLLWTSNSAGTLGRRWDS